MFQQKSSFKISNSEREIVEQLRSLQTREEDIVRESIELLRQIDQKNIFLKMGYPNLYEFCIRELKYSGGSAYRRISAMRLIKDIPEIKEKVDANVFSLSALAQVQTFIKNREKSCQPLMREEKLELLKKVENLSARDCEKEILKIDPQAHKPDRASQITNSLTELRLTVDAEFMAALNRLCDRLSTRGILNHKETIYHALKSELMRLEKSPKELSVITQLSKTNSFNQSQSSRIVIPRSLRALVHAKSGGECSYVDPLSKRKCRGRHFLEIDHIVPLYRGGTNNLNNLQLMCSAHNQVKGTSLMEGVKLAEEVKLKGAKPTIEQ